MGIILWLSIAFLIDFSVWAMESIIFFRFQFYNCLEIIYLRWLIRLVIIWEVKHMYSPYNTYIVHKPSKFLDTTIWIFDPKQACKGM